IIPKPQMFKTVEGTFVLSDKTHYDTTTSLASDAIDYLQQQLQINADFSISPARTPASNGIHYKLDHKLKEEAYTLQVTPHSVIIEANSQSGYFYATVSLMQLMDAKIWSQEKSKEPQKSWNIPACIIQDYPRFRWRGMMLDSSRNFFSVAYVKKFIDRMAQHKLNVFHWHLTDDEGWRIEIKKYPLLTQVGAKRGPGTELPFSLYPAMRGRKDKMQEGYYTQGEIREIVAYAAKRSVNILPEIDIPAHAKAAIMAYPELLQDPNDKSIYTSVQKVSNNTMDAGLKSTYTFLDNIIKETTALFPFEYIHLGGDEIPKGAWKKSPAVAKLMQKEQLKSTQDVQAYFFTKMDKVLAKHDRKMIAWQEVREDNSALRDDTIVMAWQGNGAGIKAAKNHHKVIMSPAQYLYFDQQYIKSKDEFGHTWAGPTDTKEAYSYDPIANISTTKQVHSIQGVHGCLWTETALTENIADYLAWPRTFSLSEIAWSSQKQRNWNDFKSRAFGEGLKRLDSQKIKYRNPLEGSAQIIRTN
ncbi:MAG: beta-N-acetylhexosaminidase, partial [Sulfurimonadaceae bacterium]